MGDGDGGDDDDGNNMARAVTVSLNPQSTSASAKKKRKTSKKKASSVKQSWPPRIPLDQIFPTGQFASGEIQSYGFVVDNTARTSAEETRYLSRQYLHDDKFLEDYHKAAEVHARCGSILRTASGQDRPSQILL